MRAEPVHPWPASVLPPFDLISSLLPQPVSATLAPSRSKSGVQCLFSATASAMASSRSPTATTPSRRVLGLSSGLMLFPLPEPLAFTYPALPSFGLLPLDVHDSAGIVVLVPVSPAVCTTPCVPTPSFLSDRARGDAHGRAPFHDEACHVAQVHPYRHLRISEHTGARPLPSLAPVLRVFGSRIAWTSECTYINVFLCSTTRYLFQPHYGMKALQARDCANVSFTVDSMTGVVPPWEGRRLYMVRVDPHLIHGCSVILDVDAGSPTAFELLQCKYLRHLLGVLGHLPIPIEVLVVYLRDAADIPAVVDHVHVSLDSHLQTRFQTSSCSLLLRNHPDGPPSMTTACQVAQFRPYLRFRIPDHRVALARLVFSDHALAAKRLCWQDTQCRGIPLADRVCRFCHGAVETPVHALLECRHHAALVSLREAFFVDL
ncbi:hypothetical protein EVG20_g9927 [Dentipellis fragilis]|uniref:Uncharacterized protein n=1 Tax=Dentipellis fragilis TaxID=205917 RepID=A0A4Y9XZ62_9AGAM|nr:hypothetical protein EVG20_g9927 [Dentipellis fragilis]